MARIDSILAIAASQGANELRMGTDREPRMLAYGAAKRLSIPKTDDETLRELLGEILSPDREQTMRARGRLECAYDGATGSFQVTLQSREGGFDVVFLRKGAGAPAPPRAAAPSAFEPPRRGPAPEPRPAPIDPVPPPEPLGAPVLVPAPSTAPSAAAPLAELVAGAAALRASDLHLADGEPPRVRVDGALQIFASDAAGDVMDTLGLSPAERERLESARSLDAARDVDGVGRVRVHVFHTAEGLAAAVRLLPRAAPSLASLHMPVPVDDLVDLPHGLVLVCGATGSGKSTTLAALAQEALRRRSIVLTTLEDPVEYALSASSTSVVRRRQVGRDARDFASGLRDALREDPDVLLVGEMRDPETVALALTAAETGHLVLASMHSRSAASAVERIVDSYAAGREQQIRVQLADSLRAVLAQRLLPRARGSGRIAAVEVLRVTHAVAAMVREGRTAQIPTALQSGRKDGMVSLERCLADRVSAGEVRLEDARAASNDPGLLSMFLAKGAGGH